MNPIPIAHSRKGAFRIDTNCILHFQSLQPKSVYPRFDISTDLRKRKKSHFALQKVNFSRTGCL